MICDLEGLLRFCAGYDKIFCYGAGKFGRKICLYLEEQGLGIEGFIVTNPEVKVTKILGKKIIGLENMAKGEKVGIILAVSFRHMAAMSKELERRGYENYAPVKEQLIDAIEAVSSFSGRYPSNQYVNVLLYHQVDYPENNQWGTIVSVEHFEEQMRFLRDNYPVVRFDDDWNLIKEPSVVITFDDGYADNLQNALPILEKYNIPATFFISTGNIKMEKEFWWDRLARICREGTEDNDYFTIGKDLLCINDIKEMHRRLCQMIPDEREQLLDEWANKVTSGTRHGEVPCRRAMTKPELQMLATSSIVTIGAHTVTHSSLLCEPMEMQEWEITESKACLREWLKREIELFSYPLGDYSEQTILLLQKHGFKKAATVASGLAGTGDMFRIPRNVVHDWSGKQFEEFMRRTWYVFAEVRE